MVWSERNKFNKRFFSLGTALLLKNPNRVEVLCAYSQNIIYFMRFSRGRDSELHFLKQGLFSQDTVLKKLDSICDTVRLELAI